MILEILLRNKMKELENTTTLIKNKLDELQELKPNVQEQMLENEKSGEEVKARGCEIEWKFENFEPVKEELDQAFVRVKHDKIEKNMKLRKKKSIWGKELKRS